MFKRSNCVTSFALVLSALLSGPIEGGEKGPVGWWRLDETSGTIARDSSGNGNDGTLQGSPQWDVGMIGSAGILYFDDIRLYPDREP